MRLPEYSGAELDGYVLRGPCQIVVQKAGISRGQVSEQNRK